MKGSCPEEDSLPSCRPGRHLEFVECRLRQRSTLSVSMASALTSSDGCSNSQPKDKNGSTGGSSKYRSVHPSCFLLFLLLCFSFCSTSATTLYCNQLDAKATKEQMINCYGTPMKFKRINNEFPTANFSDFNQADFDKFRNKQMVGASDVHQHISANFFARKSQMRAIAIDFHFDPNDGKPPQDVSITLESNPILETAEFSRDDVKVKMNFTVRGNKKLSLKSIKDIEQMAKFGSYIQKVGECFFGQYPVAQLDELEDCQYIHEDLRIDGTTVVDATEADWHQKISKTLTSVKGCVKIIGSQLTSIGFMDKLSNICGEIKDNKQLCIHPEKMEDVKTNLGGLVIIENNSNCPGECTVDYLLRKKNLNCLVILGSIIIRSQPVDANYSHYQQIKEIRGRLVIRDNAFTNVTFFSALETIDGSSDDLGAAFDIANNNDMTLVEFPNLKNIISAQDQKKFYYDNNLPITEELQTLASQFDPDDVDIKTTTTTTTTSTTTTKKPPTTETTRGVSRTTTTMEANTTNAQMVDAKEKEIDMKGYGWDSDSTLLLSVSVPIGILLLIVIGGSYFFYTIFACLLLKKKFMKTIMKYGIMKRVNLNLKFQETISYPDGDKLPWIKEAEKIMEKNVAIIETQDKVLLKKSKKDTGVIFYKNEDAIWPFFSRANSQQKKYIHQLNPKPTRKCHKQCKYRLEALREKRERRELAQKANPVLVMHQAVKDEDDDVEEVDPNAEEGYRTHSYCVDMCECVDHGIDGGIFGIRMEKNVEKWKPDELEICHELYFQKIEAPIVYEQHFEVTARRMQETPRNLLMDELQYQKMFKKEQMCSILGNEIKFRTIEEHAEAETRAIENQENIGSGQYFTLAVFKYKESNNKLSSITQMNIQEPMTFCKMYKQKLIHPRTMNDALDIDKMMQNMVTALMNVPVRRWITNITAEDILKVCRRTKEILSANTNGFVFMEQINVRVIGEVRGKFDDLRKGLSLPSQNAIPGVHPICNVKHIFLGNYVGNFGSNLEVLCLLFSLKCLMPRNYVLLRGANEWRFMDDLNGLKAEVTQRFPTDAPEIMSAMHEVFDYMPLICKLGDNVFCSHAGVAPLTTPETVKTLKLPIQILKPDTLPFNLIYAQPNYTVKRFFDNVEQKGGYYFGDSVLASMFFSAGWKVYLSTKTLPMGFGIFGYHTPLLSLCGHAFEPDCNIAQAEFNERGALQFQLILENEIKDEEWNAEIKASSGESGKKAIVYKMEPKDESSTVTQASVHNSVGASAHSSAQSSVQQQNQLKKKKSKKGSDIQSAGPGSNSGAGSAQNSVQGSKSKRSSGSKQADAPKETKKKNSDVKSGQNSGSSQSSGGGQKRTL